MLVALECRHELNKTFRLQSASQRQGPRLVWLADVQQAAKHQQSKKVCRIHPGPRREATENVVLSVAVDRDDERDARYARDDCYSAERGHTGGEQRARADTL